MRLMQLMENIMLEKPIFNPLVKFYINFVKFVTRLAFFIRKLIYSLFPFLKIILPFPIDIYHSKKWIEINKENYNLELIDIFPSKIIERKEPKCLEKKIHWKFRDELQTKLSATYVFSMPNGRVWGKNAIIITPDGKLLSDVSKQLGSRIIENRIFRRFKLPKLIKTKNVVGVLATDRGDTFFHWFFDVLPRLYLIDYIDLKIDKYIINYSNKLYQDQTLKILGIDKEKIIPSDDNLYLEASILIVPSWINNVSGNMPDWACEFLRKKFLPEIKNYDKSFERIYISRNKATKRKIINEERVFNFLSRYGFKKVFLEDIEFIKQVEIFQSAKIIIAPHGAGLVNLVFCKPKTRVIEIFFPRYINTCYFALSNQINLDYYYLLGEGRPLSKNREDYSIGNNILVDIEKLKLLLKQIECF